MESLSNSTPQNFDKCFLFYQIHLQTFSLLINHEFSPSDHIKTIVRAINSKCKSLKLHMMELEHAITTVKYKDRRKKHSLFSNIKIMLISQILVKLQRCEKWYLSCKMAYCRRSLSWYCILIAMRLKVAL